MTTLDSIPKEKLYFSIGEVSQLFDLPTSTIRFWSNEFKQIQPKRNKKGNRLFTKKDLRVFREILHLIKDRGYSLRGAKQKLNQPTKKLDQSIDVIDRLKEVRYFLSDLKSKIS